MYKNYAHTFIEQTNHNFINGFSSADKFKSDPPEREKRKFSVTMAKSRIQKYREYAYTQ